MKIKLFAPAAAAGTRGKKASEIPSITVSTKSQISFSQAIKGKIKIEKEAVLMLAQDEEKPRDWYLITNLAKDAGGFTVKARGKEQQLYFSSKELASEILSSLSKEGTIKIPIAIEPVELPDQPEGSVVYALLTAAIK